MAILTRLFNVIIAIVIGSGGVIALFYALNLAINLLPNKWRSHILHWVYLCPALVILTAYLILPTIETICLSFFDNRSNNFVGLDNYVFAFTNKTMLVAFRNNLLWLVLVTGICLILGLIIAVLLDRVKY